jgi:trans-aconitate methyltransferase
VPNHPRFQPQVGRTEDLSAFADLQFDAVYFNSVLDELGLALGGGRNHQVGAAALQALLQGAGFTAVAMVPYTFFDRMADVDELIEWSRISSFSNWLSASPQAQRDTVRARLAERLLPLREDEQIRLARHLVFASARR